MSFLREIQPSYRAVYYVPLSQIRDRPFMTRSGEEEGELFALAASIRQYGLLQPITVRVTENGYEVVLGQRRFRACLLLGFSYIDAFVLQVEESEATLYSLLENTQQQPLHFLDEAAAYAAVKENGISTASIARQAGESETNVEKKLALLALAPATRQYIREAGLTERHARALLRIQDAEKQLRLARQAARLCLSPHETERLAEKENSDLPDAAPKRKIISLVWEPRLYLNAMYNIIKKMRDAGLDVSSEHSEDEESISLNLKIRKRK